MDQVRRRMTKQGQSLPAALLSGLDPARNFRNAVLHDARQPDENIRQAEGGIRQFVAANSVVSLRRMGGWKLDNGLVRMANLSHRAEPDHQVLPHSMLDAAAALSDVKFGREVLTSHGPDRHVFGVALTLKDYPASAATLLGILGLHMELRLVHVIKCLSAATARATLGEVREFLRQENKWLRTMVNVTFDLYSVKTSDADEKGLDWSSVFQSLSRKYGLTFSPPSVSTGATAGSIGASMVWGNGTATTKAMLALLNQYGEASQHRPISITTLNGMWDTKSRLATEGYLKETVPGLSSGSGAAGAPGLKTDTITTGDQFAVLPYVQNDNTVLLRYAIGLSDLLGMFDVTTGSGATLQKVQTPRTESLNATSTIALAPGETAVITGLSRLVAKRDDTRLAENLPLVLGGTRRLAYQREHFLILVRATPL